MSASNAKDHDEEEFNIGKVDQNANSLDVKVTKIYGRNVTSISLVTKNSFEILHKQ